MTIYPCASQKCSKHCNWKFKWKDRTGKWKEKHFKIKADAKAFQIEMIKQLEQGVLSSEYAQKITLNEFIVNVPLTQGNETTKIFTSQLYDIRRVVRKRLTEYLLLLSVTPQLMAT